MNNTEQLDIEKSFNDYFINYTADEKLLFQNHCETFARHYSQAAQEAMKPGIDEPTHTDDMAVNEFADRMKAKLKKKRDEGREGWEGCSSYDLSVMFCKHLNKNNKGNLIDLANFLMMLEMTEAEQKHIFLDPHTVPGSVKREIERQSKQIESLQAENKDLKSILKEADDYLNTNNLTSIGNGSVLHNKFKGALPANENKYSSKFSILDCAISSYHQKPVGSWSMKEPTGIRIIHIPTGKIAECHSERSAHKNREFCIRKLEEMLDCKQRNSGQDNEGDTI